MNMATTTYFQITIVLAEAAGRPTLPPHEPPVLSVCILELPQAGAKTWLLNVIEDWWVAQLSWEFSLSADESQRILARLEQVPSQSMSLDDASFDGGVFEVLIMQAESSRSFRWRNEDWQSVKGDDTDESKEAWRRVASFANYLLEFVWKVSPARSKD